MSGLLTVRDNVRDFLRKYGEIVFPILRFILALIVFSSINNMFGYSELFNRTLVVFLLSIICALVSDSVAMLIAGAVLLVNTVSVSVEIGALFLVLFILMYTLYMRMFPQSCYVIALVSVLCLWNMTYIVPLVVVMIAGMVGIAPAGFGIIIYYFAQYVKEAKNLIDTKTEEEGFQAYSYIVDHLTGNKDMITMIIVFALVIAVTYVIYRLPFDFSWYVAIGAGGICNIIFSLVVGAVLGADIQMSAVVLWSFVGMLIALCIQFCKGILDYSGKEIVQFEDDEYYYYVKAIPKYRMPQKAEKKAAVRDKQTRSRTTASQKPVAKKPVSVSSGTSPERMANSNSQMKKDYVTEAIRQNMEASKHNRQ